MLNAQILQKVNAFYMRLSKRERNVFHITLAVIFLLLFVKLLVEPFFSKMNSQEEEIVNKRKTIQLDLRLVAIEDVVAGEMDKYSGYFSQADSAEEEILLIQQEIQAIADRIGLYVGYIRPTEPSQDGFFTTYYISVNCEGEMPGIVSFLYELENSEKLLTVERLTIIPKSEGSSIAQCRMTVSKTAIP